jgi:hypothetical protein
MRWKIGKDSKDEMRIKEKEGGGSAASTGGEFMFDF